MKRNIIFIILAVLLLSSHSYGKVPKELLNSKTVTNLDWELLKIYIIISDYKPVHLLELEYDDVSGKINASYSLNSDIVAKEIRKQIWHLRREINLLQAHLSSVSSGMGLEDVGKIDFIGSKIINGKTHSINVVFELGKYNYKIKNSASEKVKETIEFEHLNEVLPRGYVIIK